MDGLRQYFLSITAAAFVCSIVKTLIGNKAGHSTVVTLLSGIFMAITIITPLSNWEIVDIASYTDRIGHESKNIITQGIHTADTEMRTIITEETQAYILDKAASIDAEVQVDVILQDTEPVPTSIEITGNFSPYARTVLSNYIENTLGIPEDAQIWN